MKEFNDNFIRTKGLDSKDLFKDFKYYPDKISYTYSKERKISNEKGVYNLIRECISYMKENIDVFNKYKKIKRFTIPIIHFHPYYEIELNVSIKKEYIYDIEINGYDNNNIIFRIFIGGLYVTG